jgi:WhiB family transcriptional regulator, redox-sensing transcriptional regulator
MMRRWRKPRGAQLIRCLRLLARTTAGVGSCPSEGSARLVLIPGRENWRDQAACVDEPANMFPDDSDIPGNERARAVCGRCPVTEPRLLFAFASREPRGVWGGLSTTERREEWYRHFEPLTELN